MKTTIAFIGLKLVIVISLILTTIVGMVVPPIYQNHIAFDKGRLDAIKNIENGVYIYNWNGMPTKMGRDFINIMRLNGIIVTQMDSGDYRTFRYRNGYNSVMVPFIRQKFNIAEAEN